MNIPTRWTERRPSENRVEFYSEHTIGGPRKVAATLTRSVDGEAILVWENQDDAPFAVIERAKEALGWVD